MSETFIKRVANQFVITEHLLPVWVKSCVRWTICLQPGLYSFKIFCGVYFLSCLYLKKCGLHEGFKMHLTWLLLLRSQMLWIQLLGRWRSAESLFEPTVGKC
jgi:hypothetical protein